MGPSVTLATFNKARTDRAGLVSAVFPRGIQLSTPSPTVAVFEGVMFSRMPSGAEGERLQVQSDRFGAAERTGEAER